MEGCILEGNQTLTTLHNMPTIYTSLNTKAPAKPPLDHKVVVLRDVQTKLEHRAAAVVYGGNCPYRTSLAF